MPLLLKAHLKLAITAYHRPSNYQMLHALATAAGYREIHPAV